jgi:hypothetical protein
MRPDVFADLDEAWCQFNHSPAALAAAARWWRTEPTLLPFPTTEALGRAARGQGVGADDGDSLLLALIRLARADSDAKLAVLWVVRPGLTRLARRYGPVGERTPTRWCSSPPSSGS